jgi:hypothetical protein
VRHLCVSDEWTFTPLNDHVMCFDDGGVVVVLGEACCCWITALPTVSGAVSLHETFNDHV